MHIQVESTTLDQFYNGFDSKDQTELSLSYKIVISRLEIFPVSGAKFFISVRYINRCLEELSLPESRSASFGLNPHGLAEMNFEVVTDGLEVNWSGEYAVLIELYGLSGERESRFGWLILPLKIPSCTKYRLAFNSVDPKVLKSIPSLILAKDMDIRPSRSYISIEIKQHFESPGSYRSQTPQPTEVSDPLEEFRNGCGVCVVPTRRFQLFESPINSVTCNLAVFSTSTSLILLLYDNVAFIYAVGADSPGAQIQTESRILCACWFRNDSGVVLGCADGLVKLWDAREGTVSELSHDSSILALHANDDKNDLWVVTESEVVLYRSTVKIISHENAICKHVKSINPLLSDCNSSRCILFSSKGIFQVSDKILDLECEMDILHSSFPFFIGGDGALFHYDAQTSMVTSKLPLVGSVSCLTASPDENIIAIGRPHGIVEFYSSSSAWTCVYESPESLPCPVSGISWSRSHNLVAILGDAEPGSTVPLIILCSASLDPIHDWRSRWLESSHAMLDSILGNTNVGKIKERILKSIIDSN